MNKGWKCGNCGHVHDQDDDLKSLGCLVTENGVGLTRCQACGSYVITHRTGLHSGEFLIVLSHNRIRRKYRV